MAHETFEELKERFFWRGPFRVSVTAVPIFAEADLAEGKLPYRIVLDAYVCDGLGNEVFLERRIFDCSIASPSPHSAAEQIALDPAALQAAAERLLDELTENAAVIAVELRKRRDLLRAQLESLTALCEHLDDYLARCYLSGIRSGRLSARGREEVPDDAA